MPSHTVRIGLLGHGTVGRSLVALLGERAAAIEARTGLRLEITRVAARSPRPNGDGDIPADRFCTDPAAVVAAPDVDVVVELMGGIEPARTLVDAALAAHKPVVTANKALLAVAGPELFAAADDAGVDLLFEAAVGGGIPIIRPLRESLRGVQVRRVLGIVNGTTNYILTRMTNSGADYADALAEAQALGYAEADPTADVDGHDAAAKAAVLATIAFGCTVRAADVACEGIRGVTAADIAAADRRGFRIKLLAIAESFDDGSVGVRVHPTLVPVGHPLAAVNDAFNAVFVEGDAVGELMFYGRGAGGGPTASAVLGDVVDAAANLRSGTAAATGSLRAARIRPLDDAECAFSVQLTVADRPGVLARVAATFADHGVSIRSLEQEDAEDRAHLVFITHAVAGSAMRATLTDLAGLADVVSVDSVLRVIGVV